MTREPQPRRPTIAVVLAAGRGKRMRSARPKVLHEAAGRPLLAWTLAAARAAGCDRIAVVVGHGAEAIRAAFPEPDLVWLEQREQRGTGHALLQAKDAIEGEALLVVLSGDVPLVRPETLVTLAEAADSGWGAVAVATVAAPGALGRIRRDRSGKLAAIVEAGDASPEELAVTTVNAGLYALPAPEIFGYLEGLTPDNAQGELYLTDAVSAAAAAGRSVALVELADPDEASGVNDRVELARVHRLLVDRKGRALALAGVTILEPARTSIESGVEVGADTVIAADVALSGATRIGARCRIGQGAILHDTEIADDAVVEAYSVLDGARLEAGARVGPFARLRPGAVVGREARVGNFVEMKNATLGAGAKANHLAYLGDATVGAGANVGAGAVTCNYDGTAKHRTEIGARAFVGSDTMLIAPVRVGDDATTAAGSVVTEDVPDGALAIARSEQRNVPGWAGRRGIARAAARKKER